MQSTWQVEEEMEGVEEAIRSGRTDQEDLLHAESHPRSTRNRQSSE